MTKQNVLDQCTIKGNKVFLPDVQLDRNLYMEVDKALKGIGGKWNRKEKAHIFQEDPSILLGRVKEGESINLKKEFQFFATPTKLAQDLVYFACIENNHSILEPSAGQGSIVNAINKLFPNKMVSCYELMPTNQIILKKIETVAFIGEDFLNANDTSHLKFDRIIANPPFTKNQDIDHVKEMFNRLNSGGRLVSIMSKHWEHSNNKKETSFRKWLEDVNFQVEQTPAGEFKESGTLIETRIVIIDKS